MNYMPVFLLVAALLLGVISGQHEEAGNDDYHLYDLLEKANRLTGTPCLYSLFSLPDNSPADQVSRQFRQLSRTMHPDKNPDKAEHHQVLTAAHHVLKDEKSRARLRWLLDEAPPWHRATVYTVRKMIRRQQRNPDLADVLFWLLVGSVLVQFVVLWALWGIGCVKVYQDKEQLKGLGKKEVKRMEKKIREVGPSRTMANSPVYQLIAGREEYPPFPSILSLWPIAFVRYCVNLITGKFKRE